MAEGKFTLDDLIKSELTYWKKPLEKDLSKNQNDMIKTAVRAIKDSADTHGVHFNERYVLQEITQKFPRY